VACLSVPCEIGPLNLYQCEAWAREHLHLEIPVDMHLACSMVCVRTVFHSVRFHGLPALSGVFRADSWSRLRRDRLDLPPAFAAGALDDLYQHVAMHAARWFAVGEGAYGLDRHILYRTLYPRETSADRRESGAMPLFTQPEKSLLKFFDLNHMLEIKHEILSVSPASEYEGTISECLELATKIAEQAEMMSQGGYLLYLQDAGSAALSTFGIILHRVSQTQVTIRYKNTRTSYGSGIDRLALSCSGSYLPDRSSWSSISSSVSSRAAVKSPMAIPKRPPRSLPGSSDVYSAPSASRLQRTPGTQRPSPVRPSKPNQEQMPSWVTMASLPIWQVHVHCRMGLQIQSASDR
jgi:hypothetical protein